MADNLTANGQKTLDAFKAQYGATQGTKAFWATINARRRHDPGDKLLRALGAQVDRGAASGGKGHTHTTASPYRAKNAASTVKTRTPINFKRP